MTTAISETQTAESSIGGEILAGVIGAAICLGCVLPPIVHLIAGPVGPFVGGFVAGNRVGPGVRGRVIIALTVGTTLAGIGATAAAVFKSLAGATDLPTWFPSNGMLGAILAGVWCYATALSMVGATVSSSMAERRAAQASPRDDA
jgi:hypothetical protein